jgi:hypothetical protein
MLIDIAERYDVIAKLTAERAVVPQPGKRRPPTRRSSKASFGF